MICPLQFLLFLWFITSRKLGLNSCFKHAVKRLGWSLPCCCFLGVLLHKGPSRTMISPPVSIPESQHHPCSHCYPCHPKQQWMVEVGCTRMLCLLGPPNPLFFLKLPWDAWQYQHALVPQRLDLHSSAVAAVVSTGRAGFRQPFLAPGSTRGPRLGLPSSRMSWG